MAFEIIDWNLLPNQRFFVRLEDSTNQVAIDIFNTKADLDADSNRVAFAVVNYGLGRLVTVTADTTEPSSGDPIAKFNTDLDYDLIIDSADGDTLKKFQVGPFTDLPPIEDALLVTEQMIQARATLEINRGTHSATMRNLRLDKHFEDLNEGDIVSLSSTKRGVASELNRIDDISIEVQIGADGEADFFDVVQVIVFEDAVR